MGSVSTVDADLSQAIERCADIPDRMRPPDGISVPTRLQESCPWRDMARATSPAADAAPRWYGPGCCARRRAIARAASACGPCRPCLDPSPGALRDEPRLRPWLRLTTPEHAGHAHQAAQCSRRALEGENGLRHVVLTEREI
jgi:hypothetical protein